MTTMMAPGGQQLGLLQRQQARPPLLVLPSRPCSSPAARRPASAGRHARLRVGPVVCMAGGAPERQQQQQDSQQQQKQQQPAGRGGKQRRELDVNRAVRLLKLTTSRSQQRTNTLPSYMTRTQEESAAAAVAAAAQLEKSGHTPLTPLSSVDADDRWRDADDGGSSSSSSAGGAGSGGRSSSPSRRQFSASDPIRRSVTAGTRNEWALPWQESGDPTKEEERQFRRAVFSPERWAAHRSTWRYWRHFRGLFSSRTLRGLLPAISFFTAVAVLAGIYNTAGVDAGAPSFRLSKQSLDITAFAVSLLLVFRTDSSYARWAEALQTFNEVRSLSKDLARQACYWVSDPPQKAMLMRWAEAFSRALLVHCRDGASLSDELSGVLLRHEVAAVAAVGPAGAPNFVLQVISELVEQCRLSGIKEDKMFTTLRSLGDKVAVCEKLLRYPLPLAWSRHTSRFMFLWLSALPWAMWPDAHWSVVPITAVVSYLLLGIDEIGVQIEEPFGVLPLEDVCIDVQAEIEAMVERQDLVTDLLVAGGIDCEPRSTCGTCGQPVAGAAAVGLAAAAVGAAAVGGSGGGSGAHLQAVGASGAAGAAASLNGSSHSSCSGDHSDHTSSSNGAAQ